MTVVKFDKNGNGGKKRVTYKEKVRIEELLNEALELFDGRRCRYKPGWTEKDIPAMVGNNVTLGHVRHIRNQKFGNILRLNEMSEKQKESLISNLKENGKKSLKERFMAMVLEVMAEIKE